MTSKTRGGDAISAKIGANRPGSKLEALADSVLLRNWEDVAVAARAPGTIDNASLDADAIGAILISEGSSPDAAPPITFAGGTGSGTISLTALGTAFTQNFDTLSNTVTSNVLPTGWYLFENGTSANAEGSYQVSDGSSNTGTAFSLGTTAATERALGSLTSSTATPIRFGANFTNTTGSTINALLISYVGEQWRLGTIDGNIDRLDFQYSLNATGVNDGAATWIDVDVLDFASPVNAGTAGALDGNLAANRTAISSTITGLTLADGSTIWIRWNDIDIGGSDDIIAIDDFSIIAQQAQAVTIAVTPLTQNEGNSGNTVYQFTVTRTGGTIGDLDYTVTFNGMTTTAADFASAIPGTINGTIAAGSSTSSFLINVAGDAVMETDERFSFRLTSVSSANAAVRPSIGANNVAIAEINNDDALVAGQFVPSGDEFLVNGSPADYQAYSSVAALEGGGFIVTWSDTRDGSVFDIYGQRYSAAGVAVGSAFRINNTPVNSEESYSTVAALKGGGFVVTWTYNADTTNTVIDIRYRRYDASGVAIGGEFQANSFTTGAQRYSAVTALNDGGFVITWQSEGQDGSGLGIYAQRYTATGNQFGAEFRVHSTTASDQRLPSITALNDGGFAVVWSSLNEDGSGYGVYGQLWTSNGTPNGGQFRANNTAINDQLDSVVAALDGGGFVVAWASNGQDGSGFGVYARRYSAAGVALGSEFLVNTTTAFEQRYPSITALNDGGFAITWSSLGQDGSAWGIYGKRYTAAGVADGSEFRINQSTLGQQIYGPSPLQGVAQLADGALIAVWEGEGIGDGYGIFARRFNVSNPGALSINDVTLVEGNSGTTNFTFTVTRNGGSTGAVGASWALNLSGAAVAGDFTAFPQSGTVSFADGETSQTITITVQGDFNNEADELFSVVLSAPTGGVTIGDNTGVGTISNDDPAINGTAGPDTLAGTIGDDVINGLAGNDQISGLDGNDTISGGDDNDTVNGNNGNDTLYGDDGVDRLDGGADNDMVYGGLSHDRVIGGAGDDTLDGGDGDDMLNGDTTQAGGSGNDILIGGAGFDRAAFFNATGGVGVTVNLNLVGPQNTGQGMDTLVGIEHLSGTIFADTLTGDGGDNWLWGSGSTFGATVSTTNDDIISGNGGNDLIEVGVGNHLVDGGADEDTFRFTENGQTTEQAITVSLGLQGTAQASGAGNWTLNNFENLSGGQAGDTLTGDGNANRITGERGDDIINGGGGNDTLSGDLIYWVDTHGTGYSGQATLVLPTTLGVADATGSDTIDGGTGEDTVLYRFLAGAGALTIVADGLDYLVKRDGVDVARVSISGNTTTVTGLGSGAHIGTDTLTNVEHISFAIDGGAPVLLDLPGQLSINDVTLAEGNAGATNFTFTVTRSGGTFGAVSATWTLANGTSDNADFTAFPQTGTVNFADGETSQTITITVAGDTTFEGDNTFFVNLTAPTGGVTILDAQGQGTITNDEANSPPTGADGSINFYEDAVLILNDPVYFGYNDVDGDAFDGVWIDSTSGSGAFTLDGVALTTPVFVTAAQVTGGQLRFTPAANVSGNNYAEFTFRVTDSFGGIDTTANTRAINILPVNDAPMVDLNGAAAGIDVAGNYTEDGISIRPLLDMTISDIDSATLTGATVTIGTGFVAGDLLRLSGGVSGTTGSGITYNYDSGTGVLTLSGSASVAAYQAELAALSFKSRSDDPGTARTITVTVTDGAATSAAANVLLTVAPTNDAPVNGVPGSQTGTEGGTIVFSTANGNALTVSDPDAGSSVIRVKLTAGHGTLTLANTAGLTVTGDGSGLVIMFGTVTAINAALDGLIYDGDTGYIGTDTLILTANDLGNSGTGGVLTDSDSVTITMQAPPSQVLLFDKSASQSETGPAFASIDATYFEAPAAKADAIIFSHALPFKLAMGPDLLQMV